MLPVLPNKNLPPFVPNPPTERVGFEAEALLEPSGL